MWIKRPKYIYAIKRLAGIGLLISYLLVVCTVNTFHTCSQGGNPKQKAFNRNKLQNGGESYVHSHNNQFSKHRCASRQRSYERNTCSACLFLTVSKTTNNFSPAIEHIARAMEYHLPGEAVAPREYVLSALQSRAPPLIMS